MKKTLIISDLHIPYQDDKAMGLVEMFMEREKPEVLIINGDFLDCAAISKYEKVPISTPRLKEEIAFGREILKEWRKILPRSRFIYIGGNHEHRIRSYLIRGSPELYELIDFPRLIGCNEFNIEYIDLPAGMAKWGDNFINYEGIYVGHYNKVSKHSAYSAKALVDDKGVSIIQAHTHRLGAFYRTTIDDRVLFGFEQGCLCNLKPEYMSNTNWQQGCVVLHHIDDFIVDPQLIHIKNYKFVYNGYLYKA